MVEREEYKFLERNPREDYVDATTNPDFTFTPNIDWIFRMKEIYIERELKFKKIRLNELVTPFEEDDNWLIC